MTEFLSKVGKTLRYHARQWLVFIRGLWWDVVKPMPLSPVFIVGCSRAGTTLVYKTFSESAELGSLQKETHDFWLGLHPLKHRNWSSHALGAKDASEQDRKSITRYFFSHTGKRRFVDKNNQNGLCVPYLHALFPDAYFVYIKRNPGDNINSLIEGWRRPDEYAVWSHDLPGTVNIDKGDINRWCFFLPTGWRNYLNSTLEQVCAFQYQIINEAILDAKSLIPERQWIDIRYEDLLVDPVHTFRLAFEKCGISFTPELEQHCESVLARPYNAFSEIRLDKWRQGRNRERLEKVLPSLGLIAGRMGYPNAS
jgi:hypothetical protein